LPGAAERDQDAAARLRKITQQLSFLLFLRYKINGSALKIFFFVSSALKLWSEKGLKNPIAG
jgi:hypothetical protein